MSETIRNYRRKGYNRVDKYEADNKQQSTVDLKSVANRVIAVTKSYSGGMSFEVSNSAADLSGAATINIEMSISGDNWEQAVDSNGTDLTYSLSSGNTIMDAISGIPEGTLLRIVVVESLTGVLIVTTRQ
jgi:hypothetical protein